MTCAHCGTVAEPGDGFCRGCGRGLLSAAAAEADTPVAAAEPAMHPAPAPGPAPAAAGAPAMGAARWGEAGTRPFLYQGAWYSRSGEVVYQYNAAAQQWVAQAAESVPYFMRRPQFASLRTPALVLYGLFAAFVAFSVLCVVADAYQFTKFRESADGQAVTQATLDGARDFWDLARGLQSFVVLSIIPVFIWWTRRATCNAPALGAAKPEFTPGWAVGWWFIPFANWVQPCRILCQAWRVSDPSLPVGESSEYRKARLTPWIPIWWIGYWLISTLWSFPISLLDDPDLTAQEVADISAFALATDVAMALLALATIAVVRALTVRQDRANARFEVTA